MTTQRDRPDLPRDGTALVFVCAVHIENEAVIPPRTTLYIATRGATRGPPHDGRPAVTATTTASPSHVVEWRKGITVFTREIIPGDHVMDRGVVREVASVSAADGDEGCSLVHFEPLDGYPPTIGVPNRVQVYVRRVCADEHASPAMPIVDQRARGLFTCQRGQCPDPLEVA